MSTIEAQTSPILIHSARLSFIWAEVLPAFLEQSLPPDSPFEFLTRNFLFAKMFGTFQAGAFSAQPQKFKVPWLAERKQQFWIRYLVQGKLWEASGSQAWKYLVPLRVDSGIKMKADWFTGKSFIDAFYYPFGIAAAISFQWQPSLALKDLLPKAYDFYKRGKFSIPGEPQAVRLEEVADRVLTQLRANALGVTSQTCDRTQEPFSIVTIVEGEGVAPNEDVKKNAEILSALEVLTSWPADYKYLTVPDAKDVCLPTKHNSPLGSTLYAEERGRAVWHPGLFRKKKDATTLMIVEQSRRASTLSCYHRNLLFGSLQTESLGRLICYTAGLFDAGKHAADLTAHHRDIAHNAAIQLAKLYLGDKSNTWRSASVQRQIKRNCCKELKTVLAEFSEPAALEC